MTVVEGPWKNPKLPLPWLNIISIIVLALAVMAAFYFGLKHLGGPDANTAAQGGTQEGSGSN